VTSEKQPVVPAGNAPLISPALPGQNPDKDFSGGAFFRTRFREQNTTYKGEEGMAQNMNELELREAIARRERELKKAVDALEEFQRQESERKERSSLRPRPEAFQMSDAEIGALVRRTKLEDVISLLRGGINFHPSEDVLRSIQVGGMLTVAEIAYIAATREKEKAGQEKDYGG
jgi:hypothetical protein